MKSSSTNCLPSNGLLTVCVLLIAITTGITFPEFGKSVKPLSEIFLTLIFIPVIPIIFSSVTCNIAKMLCDKSCEFKMSKAILVFILALLLAGIIGCAISIFMNPGDTLSKFDEISNMTFQDMQKSMLTLSFTDPFDSNQKFSLSDFIRTLVPKNPFEAFAAGNVIQILFLSILCGIAFSALDKKKRTSTLEALDVMMLAFKKVLDIPIKVLPLGLFFTITSSVATIDPHILISMKDFYISVILSFLCLIVIAVVLLCIYSPIKITKTLMELKTPSIVAFSTCSNQATIPFLVSTLVKGFELDEDSVNIEIPLGVIMCRVGNVAYYAFISVFIATLYSEPLSIYQFAFIVAGSVVVSFAATGVSGIIAIGMISMILDPLNLPLESMLTLLIIVDPMIDPFRTVTSLVTNAALSCLVINKSKSKRNQSATVT
jgi:proton glutamate symport protein